MCESSCSGSRSRELEDRRAASESLRCARAQPRPPVYRSQRMPGGAKYENIHAKKCLPAMGSARAYVRAAPAHTPRRRTLSVCIIPPWNCITNRLFLWQAVSEQDQPAAASRSRPHLRGTRYILAAYVHSRSNHEPRCRARHVSRSSRIPNVYDYDAPIHCTNNHQRRVRREVTPSKRNSSTPASMW